MTDIEQKIYTRFTIDSVDQFEDEVYALVVEAEVAGIPRHMVEDILTNVWESVYPDLDGYEEET